MISDTPNFASRFSSQSRCSSCCREILPSPRVRLRTTKGRERINRELRRHTRVASIFPNPDSCLRLVSARLAELDDEGMTGKVYLNLNP